MTIVVTMRRLTDTIERELAARFTLRAHRDDAAPPDDALLESCRDAAVLISTSSDAVSAGLIERLPASIRLIANFGAGLNTIDVAAAIAEWTEEADCVRPEIDDSAEFFAEGARQLRGCSSLEMNHIPET